MRCRVSKPITSLVFIALLSWTLSFAAERPITVQPSTAEGVSAPTISIEMIVREVLEKNPERRFYEAEIEAAKGVRTNAAAWANPELGGSLGQKRVWNEDDELTAKGSAGEVSLMQTFEWPGRMGLRRAVAARNVKLAEIGLERFSTALAARARIAAYKLYAARQSRAAMSEVAGHFRSLNDVLSQRDPAGLTPLLETRIIEAVSLTMHRKATEALLAEKAAIFELNQLRGAPMQDDLRISEPRLEFRPLGSDLTKLVSLARENDFTVRERMLELERQDLGVGLAENERLPAVSVGPSFSEERAGEKERVIAAVVSLPLPLWNMNQGNIATAKAERKQAETSLLLARQDAERRALEAASAYDAKLSEMVLWRPDSIQHFKDAAELADRHYRLGSVPVSTYVELQTQYLEALDGLHQTKLETLEAAMALEQLTGESLSLLEEKK